jgi:hypothetical protein
MLYLQDGTTVLQKTTDKTVRKIMGLTQDGWIPQDSKETIECFLSSMSEQNSRFYLSHHNGTNMEVEDIICDHDLEPLYNKMRNAASRFGNNLDEDVNLFINCDRGLLFTYINK